MNRVIYTERKRFAKFDNNRYIVYLDEEIVTGYVPEVMDGQPEPEPITAYAYTGTEKDGGTLIEATSPDRDSLINGIIRANYTQSEEDAIKTHQIELLRDPGIEKADSYNQEWIAFNEIREKAKSTVDGWMSEKLNF